jgi:hypothetical protein
LLHAQIASQRQFLPRPILPYYLRFETDAEYHTEHTDRKPDSNSRAVAAASWAAFAWVAAKDQELQELESNGILHVPNRPIRLNFSSSLSPISPVKLKIRRLSSE